MAVRGRCRGRCFASFGCRPHCSLGWRRHRSIHRIAVRTARKGASDDDGGGGGLSSSCTTMRCTHTSVSRRMDSHRVLARLATERRCNRDRFIDSELAQGAVSGSDRLTRQLTRQRRGARGRSAAGMLRAVTANSEKLEARHLNRPIVAAAATVGPCGRARGSSPTRIIRST